ncbi:MAG: hypothetical protein KDH19_02070 [Geminicoccaceae bacterium]|nr:hypothetical protein [Geminicoccaceae bacterium]
MNKKILLIGTILFLTSLFLTSVAAAQADERRQRHAQGGPHTSTERWHERVPDRKSVEKRHGGERFREEHGRDRWSERRAHDRDHRDQRASRRSFDRRAAHGDHRSWQRFRHGGHDRRIVILRSGGHHVQRHGHAGLAIGGEIDILDIGIRLRLPLGDRRK